MHEPRGRTIPLSGPRRFISDLVYFARRVPSVPVSRTMLLGPLIHARAAHPARPSWVVLFMKAFGLVAAEHPPLRRALLTCPNARLYEHPQSICSLALERDYQGEQAIFVGLFRAPERQSVGELQAALNFYKREPLEQIGFYRQELRISKIPTPLRRVLWWGALSISGLKRAKRFGTFGISTYGSLGAEQVHPISPLTTTMTFGPIDCDGRVCVKLIYDHRVLDGAYVARRLLDIETALTGAILAELRTGIAAAATPAPAPKLGSMPPAA